MGSSKKLTYDRVLGPYSNRGGWVVFLAAADGGRDTLYFSTEAEARLQAKALRKLTQPPGRSVLGALNEYEIYLREKGNKPRSIKGTRARLDRFFQDQDIEILKVSPKLAASYYQAFVTKVVKPATETEAARLMAADSHRNYLAEAKSFLRWCIKKGWLHTNPLEKVEGVGKRSHGKPQLRIDEARRWMAKAIELADTGDLGAVGAMLALAMGMRASEIISLVGRDIDDDGQVLWVSDGKTAAARRTLHVPAILRPYLTKLAGAVQPASLLFGEHWRDWPRANVRRICELASVPIVTAHGLRGTFASLAVEAGAATTAVAGALGHEDFTTTAESYAKADALAQARQRLSLKVLSGGRAG